MHRRWAPRCASAIISVLLLGSCVRPAPTPEIETGSTDPIEAAFVVLGVGGQPMARVITRAADCPSLQVDDVLQTMTVRAAPATVPQRSHISAPQDSKPSSFPVLVCDAVLGGGVHRVMVGGHALPVPKPDPRRIVVVGDTGCRIKKTDGEFQACNDPVQWPFPQVAAAAAALRPDLVIHVGDYLYRENACPAGVDGCRGSPWGYGWDAWKADFFVPARPLLEAAPLIVVRGNHESCNRAGQGWWRLVDPRPLVPQRDCNNAANDNVGDYSEPYAVPVTRDTQFIIFDSSKVGIAPLATSDPMYLTYSLQMQQAFALGRNVAHNFFTNHHPVLGFAPNQTLTPTGFYPGNQALQSVLQAINPRLLFPSNTQAQLSGHFHLFEMVSFASAQPTQLISGNGGAWADARLPVALARTAQPAPGAVVETITSTNEYGFMTIEQENDGAWHIEARDRRGRPATTCVLRDAKTRCTPETLP
jgi:hypothetical protein